MEVEYKSIKFFKDNENYQNFGLRIEFTEETQREKRFRYRKKPK